MQNDVYLYESLISVPDYLRGHNSTILRFDFVPIISKQDIDNGSIIRYFARQSNVGHGEIIEIDKSKYDLLKTLPLYLAISIPWKISGSLDDILSGPIRIFTGVLTANQLAVQDAENLMPGIKLKLINFQQFYQG